MKISDKIKEYKKQKKVFYSFEYFPPKTDFGMDNLYSRIDKMSSLDPAYIDITWGAGGSTAERNNSKILWIGCYDASYLYKYVC